LALFVIIKKRGDSSMKLVKLFTIAALVMAVAGASFAGSCCNKGKECGPKDGKAKNEKKEEPKKEEQPKQ
jgi:hypothetical protein